MSIALIREHYDYHHWANRRLFDLRVRPGRRGARATWASTGASPRSRACSPTSMAPTMSGSPAGRGRPRAGCWGDADFASMVESARHVGRARGRAARVRGGPRGGRSHAARAATGTRRARSSRSPSGRCSSTWSTTRPTIASEAATDDHPDQRLAARHRDQYLPHRRREGLRKQGSDAGLAQPRPARGEATRRFAMHFGILHVRHRLRHPHRRAGPRRRGRAASSRCSCPSTPTSRRAGAARSRAAARCPRSTRTRTTRSSRLTAAAAVDQEDQDRHRHLPDHRARHHRHRQGGGEHRRRSPAGASIFGDRRGLERRGDGAPRHRVQDALQEDAREQVLAMKEIWSKDEAEFHGRARELRPDLVLAQARPEAEPARAHGRRERAHPPARGGLLRGLVPARRGRRRSISGRARGSEGARRREGARHEDDLGLGVRRPPRRGGLDRATRRPA